VPLAIAGTALLGLTPVMAPTSAPWRDTVVAAPSLLSSDTDPDHVALVMGGSGVPIPTDQEVQNALDYYGVPNGYGDYTPKIVFTPEGLQPIDSGIKSLPFDTSVDQGVQILNSHIEDELDAGHKVVVGGDSQSATIISEEMKDIENGSLTVGGTEGYTPDTDELAFLALGDPSNPNGGLLERFDLPTEDSHPSIPSLGITFSGAAPADTGYETDIYTQEYDGFADFPKYPMNVVSDLNAIIGFDFVHPNYVKGHAATGDEVTHQQIHDAIKLPTSDGYDGGTTYHMIPTEQLPLAQAIEQIAGKPVADLLEPDLRVIANLGYGPDPDKGWSESPANEPTPAHGGFPNLDADQMQNVMHALSDGAQKGFHNFLDDLSDSSDSGSDSGSDPSDTGDMPSLTDVVNGFSDAASHAYATLLPTADILNALTTTLPAEDISLFTHYLQEGDLTDALGVPAAVTVGLLTVAAGFEYAVIAEASSDIQDAFDFG
jgi:hypothetical protein